MFVRLSNVPNVAHSLPVGSRLNLFGNLGSLGGWTLGSTNVEGGLHSPFLVKPKLDKVTKNHQLLCTFSPESILVRGITSAYGQRCSRAGPVAEPSRENLQLLSLPACPVREFMSLIGLLTATEKLVHLGRLHVRLIQWHHKNNWRVPESLEKVIPIPRSLHPHLQWWLKEDNVLIGQPLHPIKHAL